MRFTISMAAVVIAAALGITTATAMAAEEPAPAEDQVLIQEPAAAAPAAPPEKAPPLPFHCIEGYGGGGITPMAYLVNPGPPCCFFGKPAVSTTYINLGHGKNLDAICVSETFFGRLEFSYAADRLGLGDLPDQIEHFAGAELYGISNVWLHNFNLRLLMVKEDCLLPAITGGVHFKVNDGIETIANELGGALQSVGYHRSNGTDFTLTATKTFPKLGFGRPVITTAGLRLSEAAQLGFLGFGDEYHATFEGNVAWLPTDFLVLGYEFRQKSNTYGNIPRVPGDLTQGFLLGEEDNWQTFDAAFILSRHATFVAGYGHLGNLTNANANSAWFVQLKYEF